MANIVRSGSDPFDDLFRGFFVRPVDFGSAVDVPSIKIDVKEQGDAYKVHAELPGIRKEDIHVNIDGSVVSISAERKQEKEVKEGERVLRTERYFGKVRAASSSARTSTSRNPRPSSATACSS